MPGPPRLQLRASQIAYALPAESVASMMMVSGLAMLCGCAFPDRKRLQAVQEVRRALRMCGGGKDRVLVVLQHLDP